MNNTGKDNTGDHNTGDHNRGNFNSGDVNFGNANSGHRNVGDYNTGTFNVGAKNAGSGNRGSYNSGNNNIGNYNSGSGNSGSGNTGNFNRGIHNSGDFNNGAYNSGCFNSDMPMLRMFNKETKFKRSDWVGLDFPFFPQVTAWKNERDMTVAEKKEHPSFYVTQGYLEVFDYKKAWCLAWDELSSEQKQKVRQLPNFDAVVFYDITGINVRVNLEDEKRKIMDEAMALLKASTELMNKAKGIMA